MSPPTYSSLITDPSNDIIKSLTSPIIKLLKGVLAIADRSDSCLHIGVACSGGVDSMTLAACTVHVCERLSREDREINVSIFTVDHGLFESSSIHADQLSTFWKNHGIQCRILKADPDMIRAGSGTEDGARRARYLELNTSAIHHEIDLMLLGHHAQDQAETMLMRLQSSAGVGGMRGIPPRRDIFARPWLEVHPRLIKSAHQLLDLPLFLDPTNEDLRFIRNAIRHRIHPLMCEIFDPDWVTRAARTARHLREDERALSSLITRLLDGYIHLDLTQGRIKLEWNEGLTLTREVSVAALRHFYHLALTYLTPPQSDRRRIREQVPLLDEVWRGDHNQQRSLPLGLVVWGSRGRLEIVAPLLCPDIPEEILFTLNSSAQKISVTWGAWQLTLTPSHSPSSQGAYLGQARMPFRLCLPPRGARYQPYKSPGSKRIKRLWSDRKIARSERDRLPILIDGDQHILWAPYCRPAAWLYEKPHPHSDSNTTTWFLTWELSH